MSMLTRFVRQGWIAAIGVAALAASPALAQMETIDPNAGIDADLAQPAQPAAENPGEPAPYDSAANAAWRWGLVAEMNRSASSGFLANSSASVRWSLSLRVKLAP